MHGRHEARDVVQAVPAQSGVLGHGETDEGERRRDGLTMTVLFSRVR